MHTEWNKTDNSGTAKTDSTLFLTQNEQILYFTHIGNIYNIKMMWFAMKKPQPNIHNIVLILNLDERTGKKLNI